MKNNIIQEKSYRFALRIIKLYKYLVEVKKEYVLSKQILKNGTSIGANTEEVIGGQSRNDFIAKYLLPIKKRGRHIFGLKFYAIVIILQFKKQILY